MKKFLSRLERYIPVKNSVGDYYDVKFEQIYGGIYTYEAKNENEESALMEYVKKGLIWVDETETPKQEYQPKTEAGIAYHELKKAERAEKEIVDSVYSCSDARAYLKERFKDDDVILRSKKEIQDYADSKNIYFPNL